MNDNELYAQIEKEMESKLEDINNELRHCERDYEISFKKLELYSGYPKIGEKLCLQIIEGQVNEEQERVNELRSKIQLLNAEKEVYTKVKNEAMKKIQ